MITTIPRSTGNLRKTSPCPKTSDLQKILIAVGQDKGRPHMRSSPEPLELIYLDEQSSVIVFSSTPTRIDWNTQQIGPYLQGSQLGSCRDQTLLDALLSTGHCRRIWPLTRPHERCLLTCPLLNNNNININLPPTLLLLHLLGNNACLLPPPPSQPQVVNHGLCRKILTGPILPTWPEIDENTPHIPAPPLHPISPGQGHCRMRIKDDYSAKHRARHLLMRLKESLPRRSTSRTNHRWSTHRQLRCILLRRKLDLGDWRRNRKEKLLRRERDRKLKSSRRDSAKRNPNRRKRPPLRRQPLRHLCRRLHQQLPLPDSRLWA